MAAKRKKWQVRYRTTSAVDNPTGIDPSFAEVKAATWAALLDDTPTI